MQRTLIVIGLLLIAVGLLWPWLGKLHRKRSDPSGCVLPLTGLLWDTEHEPTEARLPECT